MEDEIETRLIYLDIDKIVGTGDISGHSLRRPNGSIEGFCCVRLIFKNGELAIASVEENEN